MCHSVIGCPCELGMDKSGVIYLYLKEVHKEDLKAGAFSVQQSEKHPDGY